ncbi:hypothetical protein [Romboutsia lituseburensis]|uniref:Uncharacterized protein n=1 Tax=Romboutsia lituseburensis DSM 797 TaxID=1121325 RepID=A0A1G9S4R1_9FIRM|nr:hypothetical protein [Romboutsia lituseburensis]CEH32929.1 Hypothetical protein RLITU_0319 [Romboutsia lituseburensis]SDM30381.1 hypothetical protein SAMN04515677_10885 [Romboutsia lituseburensis DSM 797]
MIVLSRESIIEGLIELREKRDTENKLIINNIKGIINNPEINDIDKLKLINNEMSKVVLG